MKFKFGDFVTIPYRDTNHRALMSHNFNLYLPSVENEVGIVICTITEGDYNILLGFPPGIVQCTWNCIYNEYCSKYVASYIKNQFSFWFSNTKHLNLIEKQYDI